MSSYENGKRTRLGRIWNNMKKRCNNERHESYKYYGAKGIKVCEEWANDVDAFISWATNNGYSDDLTIDRIDNNKGYSPDNCRWSTPKEQAANRNNGDIFITHDGKTMSLKDWAKYANLSPTQLYSRIHIHKWSFDKAISMPINEKYSHPRKEV